MTSRPAAWLLALVTACAPEPPVELGPKDGEGLPATELDRVGVGDEAPDFTLEALSGDTVTLSDLRGDHNVVLVFYRGHW